MSRTYKDQPYWVKLKKNAVDKETRDNIKPGLREVRKIQLSPNKIYNFPLFFSEPGIKFHKMIHAKNTYHLHSSSEKIHEYKEKWENMKIAGNFHYSLSAKKIRENITKVISEITEEFKHVDEFNFINSPLTTKNQAAFILKNTNLLIIMKLDVQWDWSVYFENDEQDKTSVHLNIDVFEVNDLNNNYEITYHAGQNFNHRQPEFHHDPTIEQCTCSFCHLRNERNNLRKKGLPIKGGKRTLKKTLKDYQRVQNSSLIEENNLIEDLL